MKPYKLHKHTKTPTVCINSMAWSIVIVSPAASLAFKSFSPSFLCWKLQISPERKLKIILQVPVCFDLANCLIISLLRHNWSAEQVARHFLFLDNSSFWTLLFLNTSVFLTLVVFRTISVSKHFLFLNTSCFYTIFVPKHFLFSDITCVYALLVSNHFLFQNTIPVSRRFLFIVNTCL